MLLAKRDRIIPFTPISLTSCQAWYDATDIATLWQDTAGTVAVASDLDVVQRWEDLSGNGNHLSEATNPPTYRSALGPGSGAAIQFDGAVQKLSGSSLKSRTVFLVLKNDDAAPTGYESALTVGPTANQEIYVFDSGATTLYSAAAHDGIRRNGTDVLSTREMSPINVWHIGMVLPASGHSAGTVRVGYPYGGAYWDGLITEIVMFDAVLSTYNQNRVGQYLADKHSLTWTE